jgi:hypothetical protein
MIPKLDKTDSKGVVKSFIGGTVRGWSSIVIVYIVLAITIANVLELLLAFIVSYNLNFLEVTCLAPMTSNHVMSFS